MHTKCVDDRCRFVDRGVPLCNGKAIPIKTADERQHMLIAQNATIAQTNVGIDDFNIMNILKTHIMIEMLTRGTLAHAQVFSMCISFPSEALKITFEKCPSEPRELMKYKI